MTKPHTKLAQAVQGEGVRDISKLRDVLKLARKTWHRGDRLDIGRLATELQIGRATLFRWVGSRDELMGEVIWSYYEPTLREIIASERTRGGERIAAVNARAMRSILSFEPMRRWLDQDPEYALRIVASESNVVRDRVSAVVETLIRTEIDAGEMAPALDVETLVLLVVRISTSFLYSDVTCGREPSVESASTAIRILADARNPD